LGKFTINSSFCKVLTMLAVLLLVSGISFAQSTGMVTGTVTDKSMGDPLFGVNIFLKSDSTIGTTTNMDGQFNITLPTGNHQLVVSFTGMETQIIPIKISSTKDLKLTIKLAPKFQEFDEIVISASRFERKPEELIVSTEIIKPTLLESKNTVNIETALNQVPGVVILDEEPQIRGGSGFTFGVGSKVGVLIDNISIITGEAGKADWNLIPVENLNQVEVIKGPSSVLTGANAMSGSIHFQTQYANTKPTTKIQLYAGGFTTPKNKKMQWWDGLAYISGVQFLHSRKFGQNKSNDIVISGIVDANSSYIGPPIPTASSLDSTKFSNKDMRNRKLRLNLNYRHRSNKVKGLSFGLNGNVMSNKSSLAMAWFDDSTNFYRGYPGTVFLREQTSFYIDPFVDFYTSEETKHHLAARVLYNDVNVINNATQSTNATTIFGVYEFSTKFPNIYGLDLVAGISGMKTYSNSPLYAASGSPKNTILNASLYAELSKKFGNRINAVLGIRGEHYSINDTTNYTKPIIRGGLNYKVGKASFLRLSFGNGFRFPSIAEKYISTTFGSFGVFNNIDLQPEEGINMEFGFKQGLKFGKFYGYFDASFFWQEYQNTVEYLFGFWSPTYTPALAGFRFVNTGRSRVTGFEVSQTAQSKWGNGNQINFIFGYTFVNPVTLEPDKVFAKDYNPSGTGEFSYNSTSINPETKVLKYRFKHTMKFDIEYKRNAFSIGVSGRVFSKVLNVDKAIFDFEDATKNIGGDFPPLLYQEYFETENKTRLVLDLRIAYEIGEHQKVSIISANVLNETYSLRPLKAEKMRSVLVQYVLKL